MRNFFASILVFVFASYAYGVEPFSLKIMNGEEGGPDYFNSTDYPEGIFVVEGYFYNCPYCHENAPAVETLAEEYMDAENVFVLDVSYDCSTRYYADWIKEHNPNHPVLNDCRGAKLLKPLGISSYPSVRVLDCNLNTVYSHVDVWDDAAKQGIRDAINALVAEGCTTQQ